VVESCGKCTPCRIGSVRGVELLDQIIAARDEGSAASAADAERQLALLADLCETMTSASLCAMGTMTPNPVNSAVQYFAEDFCQAQQRAG